MPCRWLPAYHSRWAVFGWPWDDHGKDGKHRISHDFTDSLSWNCVKLFPKVLLLPGAAIYSLVACGLVGPAGPAVESPWLHRVSPVKAAANLQCLPMFTLTFLRGDFTCSSFSLFRDYHLSCFRLPQHLCQPTAHRFPRWYTKDLALSGRLDVTRCIERRYL